MQRQVILDAICNLANHPTAEEVYSHVVKMHPSISKATVYRNMSTAAEDGEILPIGIFDGAMRFDHNNHEHFHFICDKCKVIIDVPSFDIVANLDLPTKLNIKKVDLTIRGLCEACEVNQ